MGPRGLSSSAFLVLGWLGWTFTWALGVDLRSSRLQDTHHAKGAISQARVTASRIKRSWGGEKKDGTQQSGLECDGPTPSSGRAAEHLGTEAP